MDGTERDKRTMRIETAIDGYWLTKQRNLSKATIDDYTLTFRRLVDFLSDRQEFEAITSHQLNLFMNYLGTECKLGAKSQLNAWIALSSLWSWAERELSCSHQLRDGKVPRPRYRREKPQPYTQTEVQAMLEACTFTKPWQTRRGRSTKTQRPTALRDRAIIITLVDTGLRASELCALQVSDYNPNTGRIHVAHGKGDKARTVFASTSARKAIWRYMADRPDARDNEPLFATNTGRHLGRNELRHMVQRCARRAAVDGATVHRFRHTFAISFLRNGGGVLQLQEMLGHESMETIKLYITLAEVDLRQAQSLASPADKWGL